jgi:hypothetical protein
MAIFRSKALSRHALSRCYQRSIPIPVIYFIVEHGKSIKTRKARKSFISKRLLKILNTDNKAFISKHNEELKSTVVIWNHETIITVFKIKHRALYH